MFLLIGEDSSQEVNNNDPLGVRDSPFVLAMLQNVGALVTSVGKSAAKEVLLYAHKQAEEQENQDTHIY